MFYAELEHRDNNPNTDPRIAAQLDAEKRKRKQLQEEVHVYRFVAKRLVY
jgi:hypothetical protein